MDGAGPTRHCAAVARAIGFIRQHARQQPSLAAVAEAVNMSPFHPQRVLSIPCHRVIQATGACGSWRWSAERKIAMQLRERAVLSQADPALGLRSGEAAPVDNSPACGQA